MVVIRSGCLLRVFISISDEFIDRVILYLRRWCVLEGIRTALAWINEDRSVFAWSGIRRFSVFRLFFSLRRCGFHCDRSGRYHCRRFDLYRRFRHLCLFLRDGLYLCKLRKRCVSVLCRFVCRLDLRFGRVLNCFRFGWCDVLRWIDLDFGGYIRLFFFSRQLRYGFRFSFRHFLRRVGRPDPSEDQREYPISSSTGFVRCMVVFDPFGPAPLARI